jgi:hypothetical protein
MTTTVKETVAPHLKTVKATVMPRLTTVGASVLPHVAGAVTTLDNMACGGLDHLKVVNCKVIKTRQNALGIVS